MAKMKKDNKELNEVLTKDALQDNSFDADSLFKRHKNTIGAEGKIGDEYAQKGYELLNEYKNQLKSEKARIIENEKWYRLQNWRVIGRDKHASTEQKSTSAWTLNAIANKHADAMDNYPSPNVLPRESSDETAAKMLSEIIPCILDRRDYEETYSDLWWYKLKQGTCVTKIFWNPDLENGLGDIDIKKVDLLSLYFEATVNDIQDSANIFETSLVAKDILEEQYPFVKEYLDTTKELSDLKEYDSINGVTNSLMDDKVEIIDWYYKKRSGSKTVVHYIKFVKGCILYASENDQQYKDGGFYESGLYPYDFDRMYIQENSPLGFGCIDICRSPQEYIDRLNDVILKNALVTSRPRYFVRENAGVNIEEFTDASKDIVHYTGSLEDIQQITASSLPPIYATILNNKIDELKETVGNRDFSQGGTTSGVTAASAIASLMEAGSKLSRDNIKSSYRSFTRTCHKIIELIRQFYDIERCFRITGEDGKNEFVTFNSAMIGAEQKTVGNEIFERVPIFDIKVYAQKSNPFSVVSQNELALQFYQLGFFNPQMADQSLACVDMLEFEGKSKVVQKIQQNGTMYTQLQQAMQTIAMLQQQLTGQAQASPQAGQPTPQTGQPMPEGGSEDLRQLENNSLGRAVSDSKNARVNRAKEAAQKAATPKA